MAKLSLKGLFPVVLTISTLSSCSLLSGQLPLLSTDNIKASFTIADCNKDNSLTSDELKAISVSTATELSKISVRSITAAEVTEYDADKNGKLELAELTKLYQTLKVSSDSAQYCSN